MGDTGTFDKKTLWTLVALAVIALAAAVWQGSALGWPAFLLLAGIGAVALFGAIAVMSNQRTGIDADAQPSEVLSQSFYALDTPMLIVRNGRPHYTNQAYLKLAASLGTIELEGEPPSVDRMFSKKEKAASAALFRLHHTNAENEVSEETIRVLDANDEYRIFAVRVAGLKEGQLWQIEEQVEDTRQASALFSDAPVGLFSVKPDGTVIEMNNILRAWLGVATEQTPKHIKDFIESPSSLLDTPKTLGRIMRSDTRLVTNKGVVSPSVMTGVWQEMESGDVFASVALYGHSGLGMRNQAPKKEDVVTPALGPNNPNAKPSELDVLSEAPFGVAQLDSTDLSEAKILDVNAGLKAMLDDGEIIGTLFSSLFADDDDAQNFLSKGLQTMDAPVDMVLRGKNGRPVNVYFSSPTHTGCIAYVVDVSMRKELEHQLVQSQKMQAIGQLAGGVAHDFNNLLTVIRLNADDLLGRHPVGDPSYPELQKINQTVARAAGLVRKLLAFSRKQTLRTETLDVTDTLSDLTMLLKQVMVDRVGLEVRHGRGLPPIQADKGQLETVLMNLCVNARDAMVEKGSHGTINLRSSKPTEEDLKKDKIPSRVEGGYVVISVSDAGTGMDQETQEKIFEPFFTTKEQGKGTGLGLATVYGIVEQSGGHLRVDSQLGVGTTFKIYIPTATDKEKSVQPVKKKPVTVKPADLAGQGTILFVEDEDAVRSIAAKTLRKRGYTVIEAGDGEEAYELLEEASEPFDLLISDVVMPGMDGPTLLKKGRELLGDARIVFISGYAEEEFSDLLAEEPDVTFLPKPFTITQLAEKVKTVIGDPG
ncbi:MAG: response regulator [Acidimicrobiales bacterium]|nr:response regulator [Hyphomonadaceae bacterium]RZV43591.1 MAG: response regulator [Acidimicrobiales bacterium]